jgi:hypothetical protein
VRRASHLAAILACALLPATAQAQESVRLSTTLTPDRLGAATTIGFGFHITAPGAEAPPALTEINLRYPGNLGIALSGLGFATCTTITLETFGVQRCPADSFMGHGTAVGEIAIGPDIIRETAQVTIVRGPTQEGHLAMLIYANASTPVNAQLTFPALVLPAPAPFGGRIAVDVPLVPTLPGSPDVAVVSLQSTLGPQGLTYYERVGSRTIAYHPTGILLPDRCPHGGFPFAAEFSFQDGSHATAHSTVPCPKPRRTRR